MEYIESRVILGFLCLIHVFTSYASGISWEHINAKVLNGFFITELIAVTAYIVYDNLQTPPHDGWMLALVGYFLVYGLILITWVMYNTYTQLDEHKVYEMTIKEHVRFMNKDYFRGTVNDGKKEIIVLLPYWSELISKGEADKKKKVKFYKFLRSGHILVKLI